MATESRQKAAEPRRRTAGRPRKFTHEQLVEAALEVMEREGFAALKLTSLAAHLGIAHTVLYNYVESIEELEAEALQRLAMTIPMPRPGTPEDIRKQAIDCLLILHQVLLKHPGVLYPPIGSSAWKTFRASVVEWVIALTPFAESAEAAAIGHSALVGIVTVRTEVLRHNGPDAAKQANRFDGNRMPADKGLQYALEQLIDKLFPGLRKK